jgi:hypothetical protein
MENETHFLQKYHCESCESHKSREKRKMRYIVERDLQTSRIIIHSEKLVLDPKFSQDSRVKIINDSRESRFEISVCETCYKICLQDS